MKTKLKHKNLEYTAFFEPDENGDGFTVTVPSLPGLVTEVRNIKDAEKVISDAIRCYVEGLEKSKLEIPRENYIMSMKLQLAF